MESLIGLRTADCGYEKNTVTNVLGYDKKGRLRLGKTTDMEKVK